MKTRHVVIGIAIAAVILLAVVLPLAGRLWWGRAAIGPGMRMLHGGDLPWGTHPFGSMRGGFGMRGGGALGFLFGVLVIGGLAWLLASMVYKGKGLPCLETSADENSAPEDASLQILRQRYAEGELTDEEFQRMKEILQS